MPVKGAAKAGKISKPNGLQGNVNIILDPLSGRIINVDHPLFIQIDGQRVPFYIEDCDVISKDLAIVKFEFINSIEEARGICGCDVYLDQQTITTSNERASGFLYLVGHTAHDLQLGLLGPIIEFVPGDMNPVFIVDYNGRELIIPAVNEIIQHIYSEEQSVHFNLPEGLTEL